MADYTKYPTGQDLEVLLKSAAYWPEGTPDAAKVLYAQEEADIAAQAAAAEFDERTGWAPYLSESDVAQTRPFVVEAKVLTSTGVLKLNAGLLRLDGVKLNGAPLEAASVIPYPSDAPARGKPYTWLKFPLHRQWGARFSLYPVKLEVTGRWGACTSISPAAWEDIQKYGALKLLASVENAQSIASISQDGFSKAWDIVGIITQKDLITVWAKSFDKVIKRHERVVR